MMAVDMIDLMLKDKVQWTFILSFTDYNMNEIKQLKKIKTNQRHIRFIGNKK